MTRENLTRENYLWRTLIKDNVQPVRVLELCVRHGRRELAGFGRYIMGKNIVVWYLV